MISQAPETRGRLLPWASPEGKPCYLIGNPDGHLARVADNVESVQLSMAADLLDHVDDMLGDRRATNEQCRFAVARMAESLREVHRIARSRGDRLAAASGRGDDG